MKYKYYKNIVSLTIFTLIILCVQFVSTSEHSSPSDFLENLPNTPGASNFARSSFSFIQKDKKKNMKKKKKNFRRRPRLDAAKIYLESWLTISSTSFRNTRLYPLMQNGNGPQLVIDVDKHNFRINSEYEKGTRSKSPGKNYFWFRLSGRHIYYSNNEKTINILDNIYIDKISATFAVNGKNKLKCFYFKDSRRVKYKVCSKDVNLRNKWVCQIQKNVGQPQDPMCGAKKIKKVETGKETIPASDNIIERTITQPLIIIPRPSKMCNEKWDYANKGREWECQCRDGNEQSPINLPLHQKAISSSIKPIFEYEQFDPISTSNFKDGLVKAGQPIKIRFLNHSIRLFHPNMGKVITLDGAVYIAEEIVFHTPSEHTIKGERFDMEMQVIHRGVTTGDIAKTVILSLLFKKKAGYYNKFMDSLDVYNLPNPAEPFRDITESLFIPYAFLDSKSPDMPIMNPFSFYTYSGSETQPPCAERTILYITSKPIYLGSVALEMFKEAIKVQEIENESGEKVTPMFVPDNNRLQQKLNGRAIFHYDHLANCGPAATNAAIGLGNRNRKRGKRGHYEKKISTITEYNYVSGEKPSGMPGAFVVSRDEAKPDQI